MEFLIWYRYTDVYITLHRLLGITHDRIKYKQRNGHILEGQDAGRQQQRGGRERERDEDRENGDL